MAWDNPSPWVVTVGQAQDRAARAAGALNLGGIFLRGREIAQRRKEFEAEEPLRKAQEEINDLRKEEARLRLDTLMEQRRNIHETQNDIGAWVGQFGRLQTTGLENPESVKSGYDWWSEHHKLIRTPEGKALYEDWDASVKASRDNQARIKRDSENALNILERQMEVEAARRAGRMETELERTRRSELQSEARAELERIRQAGLQDPRRPQSEEDFVGAFVRSMSKRWADDKNISIEAATAETGQLARDYWRALRTGAALPGTPKPVPAPIPAPTPTPSTSTNAPVRVTTPEEAMALPSGTFFQTPDGRIKVRP